MLNFIVYEKALKRKGQKLLDSVKSILDGRGVEYEIHILHEAGAATEKVRALTSAGEKEIIAVGGDGTVNEVLNGIADPESCTLGLIPAGTGNDFAVSAKIPEGIAALELILKGDPKPTDYIQFDDGKRSMNIAGVGIDVDILQRCARKKGKSVKGKYFRSLLSSLVHYRPIPLEVVADDGEVRHYNSLIACVCNGHRFGGGIPICPDAVIDDGKLELLVADCPPRIKIPAALVKLMHGKLLTLPIAHKVSCTSARISTGEGKSLAQYDGEIKEFESFSARIVSGKLKTFRG